MEKSIKIDIPEGYEIDEEKSSFTKIVFKKKEKRPETWDGFCNMGFTGKEYTFGTRCFIKTGHMKDDPRQPNDIGYVPDERWARAFQAMFQLMSLRSAWVGDWEPEYIERCRSILFKVNDESYEKWHIVFRQYQLHVEKGYDETRPLSFPTKEMALKFLYCFKDLINDAYGLI